MSCLFEAKSLELGITRGKFARKARRFDRALFGFALLALGEFHLSAGKVVHQHVSRQCFAFRDGPLLLTLEDLGLTTLKLPCETLDLQRAAGSLRTEPILLCERGLPSSQLIGVFRLLRKPLCFDSRALRFTRRPQGLFRGSLRGRTKALVLRDDGVSVGEFFSQSLNFAVVPCRLFLCCFERLDPGLRSRDFLAQVRGLSGVVTASAG